MALTDIEKVETSDLVFDLIPKWKREFIPNEKLRLKYAIIRALRALGFTKFIGEDTAARLAENPFTPGLTTTGYEDMMKSWCPGISVCLQKGTPQKTAEGVARAFSKVLHDFPEAGNLKYLCSWTGVWEEVERAGEEAEKNAPKVEAADVLADAQWVNERRAYLEDKIERDYRGKYDEFHRLYPNTAMDYFLKYAKVKRKDIDAILSKEGKVASFPNIYDAFKEVYIQKELKKAASATARKRSKELAKENVKNARAEAEVPVERMGSNTLAVHCATGTSSLGIIYTGITLNNCFHNQSTEAFDADYQKMMDIGWHPVDSIGSGAAEAVVMHELGHHIDSLLGLTIGKKGNENRQILDIWRKNGKSGIKAGLSEYGADKIAEMVAEGFCEAMLSPHPRPIAMSIFKVIREEYKKFVALNKVM